MKTHPEILLPEYEATLWIDASILITSPYIYNQITHLFQTGIQFASVKHPYRNCIYDEAYCVYGMNINDVIEKLKGITCGFKRTSCPDQIATALEKIKAGEL